MIKRRGSSCKIGEERDRGRGLLARTRPRLRLRETFFRGRGRGEARNFSSFLGHFEVEARPSRNSGWNDRKPLPATQGTIPRHSRSHLSVFRVAAGLVGPYGKARFRDFQAIFMPFFLLSPCSAGNHFQPPKAPSLDTQGHF